MKLEPRRNVYVGHRYVPKIFGEWSKENTYEGLSIVTFEGASYTSKKHVPVGVDIKNEEYWVCTGNYNAQIEYYRKEVQEQTKKLDDYKDGIDTYVGINIDDYPRLTSENDDVGRFNRILNELVSTDRNIVYLNDGEYILASEEIEIPKDNIHFIGKGNGTVIKVKDNVSLSNGVIKGYGKSGTKFTNITFDGNNVNQTRTYHLIRLENCDFSTFEGCRFKNIHGTAIVLSGSRYCYLNNLLFNGITGDVGNPGECIYAQGIKFSSFNNINAYDIGDHLLYIDSSDVHGISEHCHFDTVVGQNCGMNKLTNGATFNICNDSHNFNFMNCHSIKSRMGFYFHENGVTGKIPTRYNLINCTVIESVFGSGFHLTGLAGQRNVINSKLTNCLSLKNTGAGTASGFRIENIEGLTMMNVDAIENGYYGMMYKNCKRVKQIGGYVYDNSVSARVQGIRVGGTSSESCDQVTITDVTSKNLNTTNQLNGLTVLLGCTNVIVKSCDIDTVLMDTGTGFYYPDNKILQLTVTANQSDGNVTVLRGSEYFDSVVSDENGFTVRLKNLPKVTLPSVVTQFKGNGFGTVNTQMKYVYNRGSSYTGVNIGLKATETSSHTALNILETGTIDILIFI